MAYKIKNVTNLLDKRHPFVNTIVDIEYTQKNSIKEVIKLRVGEELIFDANILPTSIHNLRIKKFIRVIQISENDVAGFINVQPILAEQVKSSSIEEDESQNQRSKKKK